MRTSFAADSTPFEAAKDPQQGIFRSHDPDFAFGDFDALRKRAQMIPPIAAVAAHRRNHERPAAAGGKPAGHGAHHFGKHGNAPRPHGDCHLATSWEVGLEARPVHGTEHFATRIVQTIVPQVSNNSEKRRERNGAYEIP